MLDAYFARMNFVPDIILETENIETAFALAEKGVGITVYPELFLNSLHTLSYTEDSSLDFFPLSGKETLGTLGIALMDNSYHSPAVLDFVALCRQRLALWEPLRI